MNLTVKAAKGNFFDRNSVIDAIGKARVKVLSRQGALIRKIMKNSMKRKAGHAPPGQPPYAHQGDLKDKTYFAYDKSSASCVIGPVKLGKGVVPSLLDKGGEVDVRGVLNRRGEFVPLRLLPADVRRKVVAGGKVVTRKAKVEARPFSMPALEKAKPLLAKEWKGQVKK